MRTAPASARDPDNHQLLTVLTALKKGDFTVRMPVDYTRIPVSRLILSELAPLVSIQGRHHDIRRYFK